ncbi:MAG: sphingosine kinase [Kineosporiaceae bacterium]|nr:sphingosine kinase [Kineosporiaceae bacterium]
MPPDRAGTEAPDRVISVLLAVNPTSGSNSGAAAGRLTSSVLEHLDGGRRIETALLVAGSASELQTTVHRLLADTAGARRPDALVVVGGDGMVHLGVNLVAGTGLPLGIVAAGTGNDNARELGLPVGDVAAAARLVRQALLSGTGRWVDAVRWNDDRGSTGWFSGVLGAGFDSIVNERANRWQRLRGRIRYDLAILRELPVFRPRPYTITVDGVEHRTDAVLVAVGNGPAYGGGLRICHGAVMDDGLIEVVVAGPVSRWGLLRLYPKVHSGAHLQHPAVRVLRGRRVRLEAPGIVGYADGERLVPLPLTCEVVPGAIRLLATDVPGSR